MRGEKPGATPRATHPTLAPVWSLGRGVRGRADFIRLLYVGTDKATGVPLEVAAELLGFAYRPQVPAAAGAPKLRAPELGENSTPQPAPPEPESPPEAEPPWRVVGPTVEPGAEQDVPDAPSFLQGKLPRRLGAQTLLPRQPRPLIPIARLGRVLRHHLRQLAPSGELDIERLVAQLARLRSLRHLPRRRCPVWTPRLQLYWDQARPLAFCWEDQWRVRQWLERWRGRAGLEIIVVDSAGSAVDVTHPQWAEPRLPDPRTTLLAPSELGAAGESEARLPLWASVADGARRAGARAVALVPCPASLWPAGLTRHWQAIDWQGARRASASGFRVRPEGIGAATGGLLAPSQRQQALAQALLTLLSPAVRIEPALLRALRLLLGRQGADLGTELLAWNDPRVAIRSREGMALSVPAMHALRRQLEEQLEEQPEKMSEQVARAIQWHHWRLGLPLRAEETAACPSQWAQRRAELMLGLYAGTLYQRGVNDSTPTERRYLGRQEGRQLPKAWQTAPMAAIWALANRKADRSGFERPLPAGLELRQVLWALGAPPSKRWCRLWQRGLTLELWPVATRSEPWPERPGAPLGALPLRFGQVQFTWQGPGPVLLTPGSSAASQQQQQLQQQQPSAAPCCLTVDVEARQRLRLPDVPGGARGSLPVLQLTTDLATLELRAEPTPPWATRFERGLSGLRVEGGTLDVSWPSWAETLSHDQYGLHATLRLARGVQMRLRWIPAGRFQRGSPESERGRHPDEGPQHGVELIRGYWLAETPCTQAEWEAVMGENPSHFKGEGERPVEQVSWEDCQEFCRRVEEARPGVGIRLPTEAEWEYACRAGKESAYHDGSECTEPEGKDPALLRLGWFGGNSDGRTHAVRQLKANGWGLYDVHGNVWELCEDWFGKYKARDERDPKGPDAGSGRVARGGGWYGSAQHCRAAYRFSGHPSKRVQNIGVRFAAVPVSQAGEGGSEGSGRQRGDEGRGAQAADGDRSGA